MVLAYTGDCPKCGATNGLRINDNMAELMMEGEAERMMRDGRIEMLCGSCDSWGEPENVEAR